MKKILYISFLFIIPLFSGKAQTYNLTLEDCINIAKEQSLTMLQLKQDLEIAGFNLKSTTSRFKTHIDLELSLPNYSESLSEWRDSSGVTTYQLKELGYSSTLTINQPLPTNGNIYIEADLSALDDLYWDRRSSTFSGRLRFRQPIDAFYGYNTIRANYKLAQLAYEKADKLMKRSELVLVTTVSRNYYNLLSLQKSAEIAKLNLERQTEAYDISQKKYEAGLIREVDALQMEVDLAQAQSDYDQALSRQYSASNVLKELLGIEISAVIDLKSDLIYKSILVDPEKAVQLALENRTELREKEIELLEQELNIKRQKAEGMIKGSLDAFVGKSGFNRQDKNGKFGNIIDEAFSDFGNRPFDYGIGFTISIPILDWGENRALVRAAKARRKKIEYAKLEEERSIETEVRNLVASLHANLKRLKLLEQNVAVAEKSFEITLQRYSDGDIDSQSLALERTRLNTAYTSHLGAFINYQLDLADLMRSTLYDYQNDTLVK
ncbi:TolC family protein [Parabacteroides sp. OttesenSCG-928-G06]|nr:TolC family protein [Parabacteroides sp. OttesenSCG-928-K15]MDL2282110.1 TolC family protein [Parabacteroides sp. OttesenSCG-928-G06]